MGLLRPRRSTILPRCLHSRVAARDRYVAVHLLLSTWPYPADRPPPGVGKVRPLVPAEAAFSRRFLRADIWLLRAGGTEPRCALHRPRTPPRPNPILETSLLRLVTALASALRYPPRGSLRGLSRQANIARYVLASHANSPRGTSPRRPPLLQQRPGLRARLLRRIANRFKLRPNRRSRTQIFTRRRLFFTGVGGTTR